MERQCFCYTLFHLYFPFTLPFARCLLTLSRGYRFECTNSRLRKQPVLVVGSRGASGERVTCLPLVRLVGNVQTRQQQQQQQQLPPSAAQFAQHCTCCCTTWAPAGCIMALSSPHTACPHLQHACNRAPSGT